MADFTGEAEKLTTYHSWDELESKHKAESRKLEGEVRAMLKKAKKAEKKELETRSIELQYELKARHKEEEALLEDYLENNGGDCDDDEKAKDGADVDNEERRQQEGDAKREAAAAAAAEEALAAAARLAKAAKKKGKKAAKEAEIERVKAEIAENMGPAQRTMELDALNAALKEQHLRVKEMPSDGHCLFRSIADQLPVNVSSSSSSGSGGRSQPSPAKHDYVSLRKLAASYIRDHRDEFAPFLDEGVSIDAYCANVENVHGSDILWGGQLEIRALCGALGRVIEVYDCLAPVLIMGEEHARPGPGSSSGGGGGHAVVRVTYHRHYYALGEHYNSVEEDLEECECDH